MGDDSYEVTLTRGTLREWASMLDDADRDGAADHISAAIHAVLDADAGPHAGRRVKVAPETVSSVVAEMLDGKVGTIVGDGGDFWDLSAHFPGTTRPDGMFWFRWDQVRLVPDASPNDLESAESEVVSRDASRGMGETK